MTIRFPRRAGACALLLATTAIASPAFAQTVPPEFVNADANGVDVTKSHPWYTLDEGGIGSGEGAVRMQHIWVPDVGLTDNWSIGLFDVGATKTYVQIAGVSDIFTKSGATFTSDKGEGATLVALSGGNFLYTTKDGTKIEFLGTGFSTGEFPCPGSAASSCRVPLYLQRPNGMKFTFAYDTAFTVYKRLSSVTSSAGYKLSIQYKNSSPGASAPPGDGWWKRETVRFDNLANPLTTLPTITYDNSVSNALPIRDTANRDWTLHFQKGTRQLDSVEAPSARRSSTYSYGSGGINVSRRGQSTGYASTTTSTTRTTTATNAKGENTVIITDLTTGLITSVSDHQGDTTAYQYDSNKRLTRVTQPEGNYVQVTYDSRGNIIERRQVAKSGSGLADIVTSASFDSSCANPVKCNKPNSTTDAKGNVTDYVYDSTHGGLLSVTLPAPTSGAVRPQVRYSYTQVSGAGGDPVYQLTGISTCQSGSSCNGTADEIRATTAWNSNLLPTSESKGDGTGALTASSTNTYDQRGNLLTVDGPLAGSDDTTRYRYDSANRLVGTVSPDPDGAGPLKNRAIRVTYRPDDQISKTETGTVNGQSDTAWTSFTSLQSVDVEFQTGARPFRQKLSGGGTVQAVTHVDYDQLGRVKCSTVRMNPADFLGPDACALNSTGAYGKDRLTEFAYTSDGRLQYVRVAAGNTGSTATEREFAYTANGQVSKLLDGNDNPTTYEYDGHDRLSKTRFPTTSIGASSSSTNDYEQITYDANSNVTSRRLRDATSIAFTFDNLDRVTFKDLPGSEPDVTSAYDNLGRPTSLSQTGSALSFTYDALSRNLTQVGPQGTVTSEYDLADHRTRLTYPGSGLYVDYDYLVTGEMTKVRENGATSGVGVLASYGYDNLGNRTSMTFGNGVVQNYTFDAVSRLASLTNELTGTANDFSATFSYNPASQIASTTRTGDVYAWTELTNENANGTPNGLNQLTSVGAKTLTHDARGNVTTFGTKVFSYSSENLLLSGPNSTTLAYDPAMRLRQAAGAATTRFAYDGVDRIAEYDGSDSLQRRYVHGPGVDDPIVWYEGSGTSDRRFLSSDERGSVISVTDASGSLLGINRYDEFGAPQTTNLGAFGYTGQLWMSEVGSYYYKARVYDPVLGRFLQVDPVSYAGGMNLYSYVGNDAVNGADPSGLLTVLAKWEWSCFGNCGENTGYWNTGLGGLTGLGFEKSQPGKEPGAVDWVPATGRDVSAWFGSHDGYFVGSGNTLANHHFVSASHGSGGAGFGGPDNWINTPASFFDHVSDNHFGWDNTYKSKFDDRLQNSLKIFGLASYAANNATMRPGRWASTFTYTAQYPRVVGYLRGDGTPTNWVTLVVTRLGTYTSTGLPEYRASTLYPGFPE